MIRSLAARHVMEIILVALCVALAFTAPNFLTPDNLLAVLRSVSLQGLIAFGMTMVIIVGEIDLSVGANAAFAGCLVAWLLQSRMPVAQAIFLTVLSGTAFGLGIRHGKGESTTEAGGSGESDCGGTARVARGGLARAIVRGGGMCRANHLSKYAVGMKKAPPAYAGGARRNAFAS